MNFALWCIKASKHQMQIEKAYRLFDLHLMLLSRAIKMVIFKDEKAAY